MVLIAVFAPGVGTLHAQEVQPVRVMTLDDVVRTALERSREMEVARLDLADSDQRVREAWASVYPTVNAISNFTRNLEVPTQFLPARIFDPSADPDVLIPLRFGFDNTWYGQLRADQPLFQASAFIGVGAAGRYKALRAEEVRGTAQRIATRARQTYYDVLLSEEALRLHENSVQRIRLTLDETRARQRAGLVSEYDVLRLEVQLANVEPQLLRSRNAAAAARRTLAVELGMEAGEEVRVAGSLAAVRLDADRNDPANRQVVAFTGLDAPETRPLEEIVAVARQQRSDLRQIELVRRLQRTQVRLEQVEYLPRVSLFGTYSLTAQQDGDPAFFGGPAGLRTYGSQVGVQVTMPIFAGFQRPARVEQRQVAVRQTEVQQRLAQVQIENQIRTLLDNAAEARERTAGQRRAVEQAQRGYDIVRRQFREGISSQLEVTDAEMALRESEFNYAEAVHDYLSARARLDEAAGVVPWVDIDMAHSGERSAR
ncbi:MAG: TolC family protein [Gemmatimonadetes bacterium]|nr:TolC family protein [Gemmatimonadota bacterium]